MDCRANKASRLIGTACLAGVLALALPAGWLLGDIATTAPAAPAALADDGQVSGILDGGASLELSGTPLAADGLDNPADTDLHADPPVSTPEPATAAFLALGSAMLLWTATRKRRRAG